MDITYDFNEIFANALPKLLASSPELVVLKLNFESKSGEMTYDPNTLVAALGNSYLFPHLRTFHMTGGATPDWYEFFVHPESTTYPLRRFLATNPGIRDIALGTVPGGRIYDGTIPPEELAEIFPSVLHFEGPAFIVRRLVLSSIASQLESLALNDFELHSPTGSSPLEGLRGRISLPRLKKFGILAWEVMENIHWDILQTIINAAPRLEEIEAKVCSQVFHEKDIVSKVSGASGLRVLAISFEFVPEAGFETTDAELVAFTAKLACAFPRLELVKYGEPYTRQRACTIAIPRTNPVEVHCGRARTIRPT
ncbi:unnamed protein product [Rhizoctonia solani]|uniref:Uncharacterized protein n=1 Tax=Rhizoctonia solani TaxID=456999 RepID=A0A8H3HZ26_9AGAM|nr:unnamed protein product [Rhizoctonia solani]